jgi:hypothetical protein
MAGEAVHPWRSPVLGVLLALPFVPLFQHHPDGAYDLLTLLLVLGAGVRLGETRGPERGSATGGAVLLTVVALLALFWAPWWLAVGLAVLAGWTVAMNRAAPAPGRPLVTFGVAWPLVMAAMVLWFR